MEKTKLKKSNLPLSGLASELYREIAKIPVVDAHEHLPREKERCDKKIDVTTLFSHYCKGDLEASGLLQVGKRPNLILRQSVMEVMHIQLLLMSATSLALMT